MMITDWLGMEREQILVVRDPGNLAGLLRARYPQFDINVSPTYLAAMGELAKRPVRGLLVGVDPTLRKLPLAIAGLRKAAGASSRLVLCCLPSGEPLAREVVSSGADDYLIYPPVGNEVDTALAIPSSTPVPGDLIPAGSLPTWDELNRLSAVLAGIGDGRRAMLHRLCELLAESLRSPRVQIVVGDMAVEAGDAKIEPVLVEAISSGGRMLGSILVSPRQRSPFTPAEAERLRHYGGLIAHLLDAADQQRHWQSLAMIDQTTQLPNRRYLMQTLENLLARASVERFRLTVLLFDLDGFKHFNDTYGHAAGDEIIHDTGQLFRRHCRQHDIVARFAGDEFVVIFWDAEQPRVPGSKHPTDALAVLRRFKKALESHEFPKLGPEAIGHITISGGLASFPWDAKDAVGLIDRADQALLQAKRDGKNRIYLVGAEGKLVEDDGDAAQSFSG